MGICCVTQGAQLSALWQPRGLGWGGRWERGFRAEGIKDKESIIQKVKKRSFSKYDSYKNDHTGIEIFIVLWAFQFPSKYCLLFSFLKKIFKGHLLFLFVWKPLFFLFVLVWFCLQSIVVHIVLCMSLVSETAPFFLLFLFISCGK